MYVRFRPPFTEADTTDSRHTKPVEQSRILLLEYENFVIST